MPFENRKKYFRGSFQFSSVTIQKISPLWKPDIELFRHFPKLKIAYLIGKNPSNFLGLNFTINYLDCYGSIGSVSFSTDLKLKSSPKNDDAET